MLTFIYIVSMSLMHLLLLDSNCGGVVWWCGVVVQWWRWLLQCGSESDSESQLNYDCDSPYANSTSLPTSQLLSLWCHPLQCSPSKERRCTSDCKSPLQQSLFAHYSHHSLKISSVCFLSSFQSLYVRCGSLKNRHID